MAWDLLLDKRNCGNAAIIKLDCPFFRDQNKNDFNCGGFALGTGDWYIPEHFYEKESLSFWSQYEDGWGGNELSADAYEELCDKLADIYVEDMIEDGVIEREVSRNTTLNEDERLIAFRASYDDFHFVREMSDGTWSHKMGGTMIQEFDEESLDDEYWYSDCDRGYGGHTRYLVIRK